MGATPYWYFVPYEDDIEAALQKLQLREFEAGRYYPASASLCFPVDLAAASPGAQHISINEARDAAGMDGTRSILDIAGVSDTPEIGFASKLDEEYLDVLYNTARPTHDMIVENMDFFDDLDRGNAICFIVFKRDLPSELFFAGYSFD